LESYFLIVDDVITFRFLAKLSRVFDWKKQGEIKWLGFDIDMLVKILLAFTWAFPEFDHVLMMMIKEDSKVIENESHLFLEWVRWWVKYLSCSIDKVSYNNDFKNILKMHCLVDTVSNSKKFSFCTCNVNSVMKHSDNQFIVNVYMCNWRGHVVFDTGLEKQSIILSLGLNSGLRGSKEGKTSLNWFSISTKWSLIRPCWYPVNKLSESG